MAQVVLKDVSKVFPGNVQAVSNVNIDIRDKEFLVLVGPSGLAVASPFGRAKG